MVLRNTTRLLGPMLAVLLAACDSDPKGLRPPEVFLEVTPLEISLDEGDSQQLDATLGGQPATVTWATSDAAVATVNSSGFVQTVGPGFAAITATLSSNASVMRSANINVVALTGTALTNGVGMTIADAGPRFTTHLYRLFVPEGSTNVTFTLTGGSGDADFYVRRATPPTATSGGFTCASFEIGNDELCSINNPAKGTWYVLVETWDPYAGATLTGTRTP